MIGMDIRLFGSGIRGRARRPYLPEPDDRYLVCLDLYLRSSFLCRHDFFSLDHRSCLLECAPFDRVGGSLAFRDIKSP